MTESLCYYSSFPSIKHIIDVFEGREIFLCRKGLTSGRTINFETKSISLCHDLELSSKPNEITRVSSLEDFSVDIYYRAIYNIINLMQNDSFGCRQCSQCQKGIFHFSPVSSMTVNPSMYCNSRCIYCPPNLFEKGSGGNPLPLIKEFSDANLFDKNAFFDWGGGEPTQAPAFAKIVEFISSRGYRQRINTNAIEFSVEVYHALESGLATLRISPDAGTPEIFERMKGHNGFQNVWDNIARYRKASEEVYVKINVCNYNSDYTELDAFLDQSERANILHILIDSEARSYCSAENIGPFYFTRKEFDAVHYLYETAKKRGFLAEISTYAFNTRPEYGEDGKIKLPSKYFDNIDHDVLSNEIFITMFPTVELLVKSVLEEDKTRPIVVFGAGSIGQRVIRVFDELGIEFVVIDNDKKQTSYADYIVYDAGQFFSENKRATIILARAMVDADMMKQINQSKIDSKVYWTYPLSYTQYIRKHNLTITK